MLVRIHHLSHYRYTEAVRFTPHRILLRPRENPQVRVREFSLSFSPEAQAHWMTDAFDNPVAVANFSTAADEIRIEASLAVELRARNPFDFIIEPHAQLYPFAYTPHERKALLPYLEVGSPSSCAKVLPWVWNEFPTLPNASLEVLTHLNQRIHDRLRYRRRDEPGVQTPDQTLSQGEGSCRDFACLLIEICRQLGFAARFVSGYLYDPPTGAGDFENLAQGAMHAWVEVHLPGAGWKGFDPTNGILANHRFIPCAVAFAPKLTSPIQGSYFHPNLKVSSTLEVVLTISADAVSAPDGAETPALGDLEQNLLPEAEQGRSDGGV